MNHKDCDITQSFEFKSYLAVSKEVQKYLSNNLLETPDLSKRYKKCLNVYRNYLSRLGINVPHPIYPYDRKNKKTWKYLDCILNEEDDGKTDRFVKGWILNNEWIYKE